MFNKGINQLLEALPTLSGMSAGEVRKLLTRAWLDVVGRRDLDAVTPNIDADLEDLHRLATALEVHIVLTPGINRATVRASAFVAAEAIEVKTEALIFAGNKGLTDEWLFGSQRNFERVEAGLLYLIAGYDANAALVGRSIEVIETNSDSPESVWLLRQIKSLLGLKATDNSFPTDEPSSYTLNQRIRREVIKRLGDAITSHLGWLTYKDYGTENQSDELGELIGRLENADETGSVTSQYADLHHIALLLKRAIGETHSRAIRDVPSPSDDGGRFDEYKKQCSAKRPLLWPAAAEYAAKALPGPTTHAIVSVPTGAGKSAVAELAISQAVRSGWVLYLVPTNALVGQVRRELQKSIGRLQGVKVRDFLGGSEYTELVGEDLGSIEDRQVLVMTPEKCSLALRQDPQAFDRLALCVVDEAHIIGERGGRGVVAELVVAEILYRSSDVRMLMTSALIANPEVLAEWFHSATNTEAIVIDNPWRPTRTLRAIAGFAKSGVDPIAAEIKTELENLPPNRRTVMKSIPLSLLAGLHGAWRSHRASGDFAGLRTQIQVPLKWRFERGRLAYDGSALYPTVKSLVQALGEHGHNVLVFVPKSRHQSFVLAREIDGFAPSGTTRFGREIDALLLLSDKELGADTALRALISKGVAIHTSALLNEERRASELAFEGEAAKVLFATSTLAQGLNLPATAVVIGGTDIGRDTRITPDERRRRENAQLLNAIGRAGRANVAPRSLAIVVPNNLILYGLAGWTLSNIINQAQFLEEEDASLEVTSQLNNLMARLLDGSFSALDMALMSDDEQAAFSFLSFTTEGADAQGVLKKSWALHGASATDRADDVAVLLGSLGTGFLAEAGAPAWIAGAAHRAGLRLPAMAKLYIALKQQLDENEAPITIKGWTKTMLNVLKAQTPQDLEMILSKYPYGSCKLADIWNESPEARVEAWGAFEDTIAAWQSGQSLMEVATKAQIAQGRTLGGRGPQDPLPRILKITNDGFGFGLAMIAGSLGAIIAAGAEAETEGPWAISEQSLRALGLLPLAIRLGANEASVVAWIRAGVRTRVVAHLLNDIFPVPPGNDEGMRTWAEAKLTEIAQLETEAGRNDEERELIKAMIIAREIA